MSDTVYGDQPTDPEDPYVYDPPNEYELRLLRGDRMNDAPITRCPVCGVWDGKGSKHADDCLNG